MGPGMRAVIWFQGCTIKCRGCIAPHTWEFDDKFRRDVRDVADTILNCANPMPEGLTITGGEPLSQAAALFTLLTRLRECGMEDIILYSGHTFDFVGKNYPGIIGLVDVLIDGPFVEGLESDLPWKGSQNQQMIILTKDETLRKKYVEYREYQCGGIIGSGQTGDKRKVQILARGDYVYVIGIPHQKDSEAIKNGFS
ncbi:MAG: radical SAM protein [Nitrospirae bacterium]|nr:radical SAM protein [Nitrospirota bacterium]